MRFPLMAAVPTVVTTASFLAAAGPAHAAHNTHAHHHAPRPHIAALSLVNADTDQVIRNLRKHSRLDLSKLPTANLNIVAHAPRSGSVRFTLDGRHVRLRNGAPYAFAGDQGGDLLPWTPSLGRHVLKATPYAKRNSKGRHGRSRKIVFRVVRSGTSAAAARSGLSVSSLSLVDADTDKIVQGYASLTNGVTINVKSLALTHLTIAANTLPATVGSVAFDLDGRRVRLANAAPYALGGAQDSDLLPWQATPGAHTLKVTPYRGANLSGRVGAAKTLSFTVTNVLPSATVATTPTPATRSSATPAAAPAAAGSTYDLALRPFGATSPWNTPVSAGAVFGGTSDARTSALLGTGTYINAGAYSTGVYIASAGDPTRTISSPEGTITIKVPADAAAAAGTDGTMTIIDPTHTYVDDFWVYNGNTSAQRHVRTSLTGSGIEGGIRAAGFSAAAGLIRKWEVDAGNIDHALEISIPSAAARKGYVAPAIAEDSYANQYSGSIPLGTRFAIPPSVNINSLGLSAPGLLVARALQIYGGYVGDTSAPGTNGNTLLSAEPSLEGTAALTSMRNDLKKIRDQLRPVS